MASATDTSRTAATEASVHGLTRRSLLRGSAGLALPLLPVAAVASTDTPVVRMFRKWDELQAYLDSTDTSEADFDAGMVVIHDLEDRMRDAPITCLEDLAAKVVAGSLYGHDELPIAVVSQCRAILAGSAA